MTVMSKATKRKHVTKEVLDEFVIPDDSHQIVKVRIAVSAVRSVTLNLANKFSQCTFSVAEHYDLFSEGSRELSFLI